MQRISLEWLDLKNGHRGKRPKMVPDGDVYQRILSLKSEDFVATMPLQLAVIGLLGETIEAPLGVNLYKNKLTMADSPKKLLEKIMESMGVDFEKSYSVSLFDGTKRVVIIDESGYHYATKGDPIWSIEDKKDARQRANRFSENWRNMSSYNFWERDSQPQADAIMTNLSGQTLCVYSADCALGLISDPEHHAIGVFHAMWRNLVNRGMDNNFSNSSSIVEELVKRMQEAYRSNPANLEVQLFPCVSKETYIVDADVAESFHSYGLGKAVTKCENSDKSHIDLARAVSLILQKCGVNKENIHYTPFTTDDVEFPSLRNSAKGRGHKEQVIYNPVNVYLPDEAIPDRDVPLVHENTQNVLIVQTL